MNWCSLWFQSELVCIWSKLFQRILDDIITDSGHHEQFVPHQHDRRLLTLRSATPAQVKKGQTDKRTSSRGRDR